MARTVTKPATPATRTIANAHKYHAAPRAVATGAVTYVLTAHGAATASNAAGKSGKPTAMAAVAVAAAHAIAKAGGQPVTGLAIVAAMRSHAPAVAMLRACRATKYVAGGLPCPAWCSGYVAGAARGTTTGGPLLAAPAKA